MRRLPRTCKNDVQTPASLQEDNLLICSATLKSIDYNVAMTFILNNNNNNNNLFEAVHSDH